MTKRDSSFRVFLDDERKTPGEFNVRVFTFEQAILFLKTRRVSLISLDHDLGINQDTGHERKTGYHVLTWLEEVLNADDTFPLPEIKIHSDNGPGRKRMEITLLSIDRISRRRVFGEEQ